MFVIPVVLVDTLQKVFIELKKMRNQLYFDVKH